MKKKVLALLLSVILVMNFVGCNSSNNAANPSDTPKVSTNDKYAHQAEFDLFTDEIFKNEVQNDSITLNYTISKPELYDIKEYTPTFGTYSAEEMKNSFNESKAFLEKLQSFQYDLLSEDQQVTYDILKELLDTDLSIEDYVYYNEILGPTTGFQAQLPVLLAEFNFYDKDDVYDYLDLLLCTKDYFEGICNFEREKSEAGLYMSDKAADDIVDQCKQFIANPEENYLITIFNDKIEAFDFTEEEKTSLKEKNKSAILENVIPAYQSLIDTLLELKGTGKNTGGLCGFEKGKEFYSYLVKQTTGSSRSMDEINSLLDNTIAKAIIGMQSINAKDASAIDGATSPKYSLTDPEEILSYLEKNIKKDFPELKEPVNCSIKYVHKSLEDHMSPAFYLTPPIDNYGQNNVYINRNERFDLSGIFTTIAHEGYPGHLYQTVYYHQQSPSLIRSIVDFGGYSEGWATYVERYSYGLSNLDKNVAALLQYNLDATLCMYAKVDIGVNYYGWDLSTTKNYLATFGIEDADAIAEMYITMIEEPCNYLKYTLGYLEINELKEKAQRELGDKFVLKEFHEFFLQLGPAQFNIIEKYMDKWIANQQAQ